MRSCCLRLDRRRRGGFTLLEALATVVVLLLVFLVLAQFMDSVERSWRAGASDPFAEAQSAFETIARNLSAATLESYEDYADSSGGFRGAAANFTPTHLARHSDLAFACGPSSLLLSGSGRNTATCAVFFVMPAGQTQLYAQAGLSRLLNAEGYFVEFGGDSNVPGFLSGGGRYRWRLKQIAQPSESLQVFASMTSAPWISELAGSTAAPAILAENVIALVILPERAAQDSGPALAPGFSYDSRDATNLVTAAQLPSRARIMLIAIDEASAQLLAAQDGTTAPPLVAPTLFQNAAQLDADVAALDSSLTSKKIHHRIFQREVVLAGAAWSDSP